MGNHDRFLQNLRDSDPARWLVARRLSAQGHTVCLPPAREAPTASQWEYFADNGDLQVSQKRVEVKRLSVDFTGAADWPYGDKFIVCALGAWERAQPKPVLIYIVSVSGTHAGIVRGSSRQQWTVGTRFDKRYNQSSEYLFAPLDCVQWVSL